MILQNKHYLSLLIICAALSLMFIGTGTADAINAMGRVHCDTNLDGIMSPGDALVEGIDITITSTSVPYSSTDTTDFAGYFSIPLLSTPDTYIETIDGSSLPGDAVILVPPGGQYVIEVTDMTNDVGPHGWLFSSLSCVPHVCGNGIVDYNEECDDGNLVDGDGCSSECIVEDDGEGCTPGYWKNHTDMAVWDPAGLSPADMFGDAFGCVISEPDVTLLEALSAKGGGYRKCLRHGTAALLNASHEGIDYPFTVDEIIEMICAEPCEAGALSDANELSDTCPAENYH